MHTSKMKMIQKMKDNPSKTFGIRSKWLIFNYWIFLRRWHWIAMIEDLQIYDQEVLSILIMIMKIVYHGLLRVKKFVFANKSSYSNGLKFSSWLYENRYRRVNTSGPHLINELRYLPQEKCLSLSEHISIIKTAAYQFKVIKKSSEFSHKLVL